MERRGSDKAHPYIRLLLTSPTSEAQKLFVLSSVRTSDASVSPWEATSAAQLMDEGEEGGTLSVSRSSTPVKSASLTDFTFAGKLVGPIVELLSSEANKFSVPSTLCAMRSRYYLCGHKGPRRSLPHAELV